MRDACDRYCADHATCSNNTFPILLFIVFGLGLGVLMLAVGTFVSPSRPDPEKLSPYECGFEAFEDARMKFDVRYYLVAILFILFDLEIAFLFPWAVVLPEIGLFGFVAMMVFLRSSSSASSTNGRRARSNGNERRRRESASSRMEMGHGH